MRPNSPRSIFLSDHRQSGRKIRLTGSLMIAGEFYADVKKDLVKNKRKKQKQRGHKNGFCKQGGGLDGEGR